MHLDAHSVNVIKTLHAEAVEAGDNEQVRLCRSAGKGNLAAFVACFKAISNAGNVRANWDLYWTDSETRVDDPKDLHTTLDGYEDLILASLTTAENGIVNAPNGLTVYAAGA